jgi:hypothetical protein
MAHQVFTVAVSQVFKGDAAPGTSVSVKQLPGEASADDTGLVGGAPALLFLQVYDDVSASPLNPIQGWYRIDAAGAPVPLPDNPVRISLAQLAGFAEPPGL